MRSGQQQMVVLVLAGGLALGACGGSGDDKVAEPPVASPTAVATSAPSPTPGGSPQSGLDLEAKEQLLADIVDQIDDTAKGFAQILQNPESLKLRIFWKGEPPADVRALEGTTGTGVEVVIVEAKLSKADVEAAIARITQAVNSGKLPNPDSILASRDFDSIVIGFAQSRLAAYDNAKVRGQFEAIAKVPVTITLAGQHAPD